MRRIPLIACIVLIVVLCLAFYARELGCRLRTDRLNAEVTHLVPTLAHLLNDYTRVHHETGVWPTPGTIDDDFVLPFLGTRSEGGERIDTYGTLMSDRRIDIVLAGDGTVRAAASTVR